jgi:exonuclease III
VHASTFKKSLMALQAQIDANTVMVGDLNTSLLPIDRSSRQKINKESSELLHTLDQIDMVDTYRVFHPTARQYTFFSAVHGIFSKIDHILGHKVSLNKFKKIEITPCIISDHDGIKLDLNNKRNPRKYSNTWRLNNTLQKNQWVMEVKREEIKKFLESNESENTTYKNL